MRTLHNRRCTQTLWLTMTERKSPQIKSAKHGIKTWRGVWFSGVKRFFGKKKLESGNTQNVCLCKSVWTIAASLKIGGATPKGYDSSVAACRHEKWEYSRMFGWYLLWKEGRTYMKNGAVGQTVTRDTCLTVCWSWWYNRSWLIRAHGDLYNIWFIWRINRGLGDFLYFVTKALC